MDYERLPVILKRYSFIEKMRVLQYFSKQIMDINFPKCGTISCVYRKPNVIIPNGKTVILPNDCLFIVSAVKDQKLIIDYAQREKENKEENNSL